MNISIVIPNYNGEDLLSRNLPKVIDAISHENEKIEIVIADDASRDNSVETANKLLHELITQRHRRNMSYKVLENKTLKSRGFSGNVNQGVKETTGDIVILLNTDVVPHRGFLLPLLSHFSDENVFAVGCMDESIEDGHTINRGRGIGHWVRGFLVHSAGRLDKNNTLWVSGGSGAFRRKIWNILGGLNELYNPFYWEDIDLSYRAQKAGHTVLFEAKSVVVHEHSKGAIKKYYSAFNVRKIAYRNQFLFTWLNATDKMLIISHFFWLPYHVVRAVVNCDVAFVAGFVLALGKLSQVIAYKQQIKPLFVKSDKEVVAPFI